MLNFTGLYQSDTTTCIWLHALCRRTKSCHQRQARPARLGLFTNFFYHVERERRWLYRLQRCCIIGNERLCFRTTSRLRFLSLHIITRLDDQSPRLVFQDVYKYVLQTVLNLHANVLNYGTVERLEYQLWKGRQAWASKRLENWSRGLWKYVFRTTGRSTFLSLHTRLEDQSRRLVFKRAMKTCCKLYSTVLKRAPSLGFKTSRKLVLRALKTRLENNGSVNLFLRTHLFTYTSFYVHIFLRTHLQD